MQFTSYGIDLHTHASDELIEIFKNVSGREVKVIFTHSSSAKEWGEFAEKIGVSEKIFNMYEITGNIVSASIPVNLDYCVASGGVKRGDKIVFWVGSAGMSFNATSLTF